MKRGIKIKRIKENDEYIWILIIDTIHIHKRNAVVSCNSAISQQRATEYPFCECWVQNAGLAPLIITCALCSLHKSFSEGVPEPRFHLSQLISSNHCHHQVWRRKAPLLCQHLVDQHCVCVAAHPHKLSIERRVNMSALCLKQTCYLQLCCL